MAYGIGTEKAQLLGLIGRLGARRRRGQWPRFGLVLRLIDVDALQAGFGPLRLERVMKALTRRLAGELGLTPQPRVFGVYQLCGLLSCTRHGLVPHHMAKLEQILRDEALACGLPVVGATIAAVVCDPTGRKPVPILFAAGERSLNEMHEPAPSTIRYIELLGSKGANAPVKFDNKAIPTAKLSDQFNLSFAPEICCDTGRVAALGLVADWKPNSGATASDRLVSGLGNGGRAAIRRSIFMAAFRAARAWDSLGLPIPMLSIALASNDLADPNLAEQMVSTLACADLPPSRVQLMIEDVGKDPRARCFALHNLERLAHAGCEISVSGFGAGKISLSDLGQLGAKKIRIGRQLVLDCGVDPDQQRLILAVLAMAENLGLKVSADGVATVGEQAFLTQIGLSSIRGPSVGAEVPLVDIAAYLALHDAQLPKGQRLLSQSAGPPRVGKRTA